MAVKLSSYITVLLALCQIFREADTQHCSGKEESISGMMLRGHIYKKITGAPFGDVCLRECYRDDRCQSFNYVIWQDVCELNNRTKEARPEDFVPNSDRYYFKRDCGRVPLGSIPKLPAETCKEIKASEGRQAVSGKYYWFDSIIPGATLLAHCDMKKEDVDECSTIISVCDVNAKCQNTRGSYRCSCKPGYTGDGKTCTDVDECSASVPVCDVNANCQNIRGSYRCSCKAGFTGEGKTCTDLDECNTNSHGCHRHADCQNTVGSYNCTCKAGYEGDGKKCNPVSECNSYKTLAEADRKVTYSGGYDGACDNGLTTSWYRFAGAAGTKMPTSPPGTSKCGTHAAGWLNGAHPTVADGQVTRQVCFHWTSGNCQWQTSIAVRNCGSFYVYNLNSTPNCNLRYCGSD